MANAWIIPPLPITSATASETAPGYAPGNVNLDYRGIVWRSSGAALPWLKLDFGADVEFDTVALFGLRGSLGGTATVRVATAAQGSGFGAGAYTEIATGVPILAGAAMPVSGLGVGLYSSAIVRTARYVMIQFAGLASWIEVSRAAVGARFRLERNYSFGAGEGVRDLGKLDFSSRGVLLRYRGAKLSTLSLTFSTVRRYEIEQLVRPMLKHIGNTECVAIVTDPDPHDERQNRSFFGPLVGDLGDTHRVADGYEVKFNQVGLF